MANVIYAVAVLTITAIILLAGLADLVLYLSGQPTISAALRLNPEIFWVPFCIMIAFMVFMVLHLFILK